MNITDTVLASELENGDQALINGVDPLEKITVTDLGAAIKVAGFSWNTGDTAVYLLDPYKEVDLWTA